MSLSISNNNHINLYVNHDELCSICYEIYTNMTNFYGCQHGFCNQCFNSLGDFNHYNCPVCRRELDNNMGYTSPHTPNNRGFTNQ